MDNNKIKELLKRSIPVFNSKEVEIPTKNGVPSEHIMDVEKNNFIYDTISVNRDKLVHVETTYPKDNKTKATLLADFYIISKKDLQEIKDIITD